MTKTVQKTLHCPCGRQKVIALGLCASCYNLKRQDEEYFGGLREQVLERDDPSLANSVASRSSKTAQNRMTADDGWSALATTT
jgi:hypothetical protein